MKVYLLFALIFVYKLRDNPSSAKVLPSSFDSPDKWARRVIRQTDSLNSMNDDTEDSDLLDEMSSDSDAVNNPKCFFGLGSMSGGGTFMESGGYGGGGNFNQFSRFNLAILCYHFS